MLRRDSPTPREHMSERLWMRNRMTLLYSVCHHHEFVKTSHRGSHETCSPQVLTEPNLPSGLRTIYRGIPEAVEALPQKFLFNLVGDGLTDNLAAAPPGKQIGNTSIPAAILIVPRRNNGPIVDLDRSKGIALSVQ